MILNTDDSRMMNSLLEVEVDKSLDLVRFIHHTQGASGEKYYIYPHQIPLLIKYLQEAEAWIKSGYKDKLKPQHIDEFEGKEKKHYITFKQTDHDS